MKQKTALLIRISNNRFVAAVDVRRGLVVNAAPILRYMLGWNESRVVIYANSKRWQVLKMPYSVIPDKFAMMVIDPGKTTGVATGIFRTDKGDDMIKSVFARAVKKKTISSWEEKGDSELQAWCLATHWSSFLFKCNVTLSIPIPNIYLVVEDFKLRQLNALLFSVEVISGLKTLLIKGIPHQGTGWGAAVWPIGKPEFQQPSQAKRRTNQHLKDLGIYVPRSEHERDVRRHMIVKVDDVLNGKG